MREELFRHIELGATVLTPTRRLARHIKSTFDQRQRDQGRRAWPSADVLPWSTWIERCIDEDLAASDVPAMLAPSQEDLLWQSFVSASSTGDIAGLSRLASQAWSLQWAWRVSVGTAAAAQDVRAYQGWSKEFDTWCRRSGWVSRARAPDYVIDALERGERMARRVIVLYAFDALTPQQEALLRAFATAGGDVHHLTLAGGVIRGARVQAASVECEFRDIAIRALDALRAEPSTRVGVIVPDLPNARSLIARAFDDVFEPMRILDCAAPPSRYYNFSLGEALAEQPVVRALMAMLTLANEGLALAELGGLLMSPFLAGGQSELGARAQLDAELRRRGALHWTLDGLRTVAQDLGARGQMCPVLCAVLDTRRGGRGMEAGRKRNPSQWCETFKQALSDFGWPGERALSSVEFQVVESTRSVIEKLNLLDVIAGTVACNQALGMLARLLKQEIFQPETPDAPIQVMGILESAGIEFDCLHVSGMHAEAWPAAYQVHPLLPLAVQRAQGMPHASPEWELGFAERMMRQWSACARQIVYSHAAEGENGEQRASLLTSQLPAQTEALTGTTYCNLVHQVRVLERAPADVAPPWPISLPVGGGASVLKNQSACPFRAFAAHRLGARALDRGRIGLDARERGNLLHTALRDLYMRNELTTLLDPDQQAERELAIESATVSALDDTARRRPDVVTPVFRQIEAGRLATLLRGLLELERTRAAFRVVGCESPRDIQLGGLQLSGRLDRVDELLSDGAHRARVIIDYKTGESSIKDWFGERPDDPQMPLYAIAGSDAPIALILIRMQAEAISYSGVSFWPELAPGIAEPTDKKVFAEHFDSWDTLLAYWRKTLLGIAEEFLRGRADVDPKYGATTCRNCVMPILCRVAPLTARPLSDEESSVD